MVVLAGDIARPPEAIAWAQGFKKPVVLVPGNHEFYGSSLQETVQELRQLAQGTAVHVLDNDRLVLDGIRFLGSTLWTDFLAAGSGAAQQEAMLQSRQFNRDFSRIRAEPGTEGRLFTPQDCAALFACNAQWLRAQLALPFAGPTVVVTHHAPSLRSVPARFAGSPLILISSPMPSSCSLVAAPGYGCMAICTIALTTLCMAHACCATRAVTLATASMKIHGSIRNSRSISGKYRGCGNRL